MVIKKYIHYYNIPEKKYTYTAGAKYRRSGLLASAASTIFSTILLRSIVKVGGHGLATTDLMSDVTFGSPRVCLRYQH